MKTPDEIKKGLECCSVDDLHCGPGCPYKDDCLEEARYKGLESDALAYIQQLETANAELLTEVKQLEAKCHQLERERDAAVGDLKYANVRGDCWHCKHANNSEQDADCYKADCDCETCQRPCPCAICVDGSNWEWRGVKED